MEFKVERLENSVKVSCNPKEICPKLLMVEVNDDMKIVDMEFIGGCNGNLKAIRQLILNQDAMTVAHLLANNTCGNKDTSCGDAISQLVYNAIWHVNSKKNEKWSWCLMKNCKWNYEISFNELKLMNTISLYVKDDSFIYNDETITMDTAYLKDVKNNKWVQIVYNGKEFVNTGNVIDDISNVGKDKLKFLDYTQRVLYYL